MLELKVKTPPESRGQALACLLLTHLTRVLMRLRWPHYKRSLLLQLGLSSLLIWIQRLLCLPRKMPGSVPKLFSSSSEEQMLSFSQTGWKWCFVLPLSLSSEALAFEIRLKVSHRVYARSAFSCPSALGRAVSSELSPQCPIKVQCTLIECILWFWKQERWHLKNPQLWEQVHGLLLYWMGVIVSWSLSVCPGYILVHFLRAVNLSFATWLLQLIFPGSQYSLQRLQVQRKHLALTAAPSLCGLRQLCWPLLWLICHMRG